MTWVDGAQVWAPPGSGAGLRPDAPSGRWRADLPRAASVLAVSILLGAPAGLLWSQLSPRLTVQVTGQGLVYPDLEGTDAFIGADGSYVLVMAAFGLLCGAVAWFVARRSGPWTVGALAVGGVLAALVAQRVGLQPGSHEAIEALAPHSSFRGTVELFLGVRTGEGLHLRSQWAAVAWPVSALVVFLVGAVLKPDAVD